MWLAKNPLRVANFQMVQRNAISAVIHLHCTCTWWMYMFLCVCIHKCISYGRWIDVGEYFYIDRRGWHLVWKIKFLLFASIVFCFVFLFLPHFGRSFSKPFSKSFIESFRECDYFTSAYGFWIFYDVNNKKIENVLYCFSLWTTFFQSYLSICIWCCLLVSTN